MAKLTLIEIVNDIANSLDTEPVNSIDDTVESIQIAQIVKSSYFELIANRNWPHLKRTIQLDSVADTAKPTHLQLPVLIKELLSFSYNKLKADSLTRDRFTKLDYIEPDQFLSKVNSRNLENTNVTKVTDFGGAPIYVMNDKQPSYYTSFDDEYIVLDSYDLTIEDTLQSTNTQALVYFEPSWTQGDQFIPELPSEAFPLLIEEAKSTAFVDLKQQANAKTEQKARRQNKWLARKAWRVEGGIGYPNYGRSPIK